MGRTKDIYIQQLQEDINNGVYDKDIYERGDASRRHNVKQKIKSNEKIRASLGRGFGVLS